MNRYAAKPAPSPIFVKAALMSLISLVFLFPNWCAAQFEKDAKKTVKKDATPVQKTATTTPTSKALYEEIIQILQTRYADPTVLTTKKIGQAAVSGALDSLAGSARIVSPETKPEKTPPPKAAINSVSALDPFLGYLRLDRIENDTAGQLENEIQKLLKEKHATGLILDLRYARGTQYAAVPAVASLFFNDTRPLFSIQHNSTSRAYQTTPPVNPTDVPLLVLVNGETREAPEVLAAVLKDQGRALLLGNSGTAGQAYETSDIGLSNGLILRLATGKIFLAHGGDFFLKKIQPDVIIALDGKLEKETFDQPFQPPEMRLDTSFFSEAVLTGRVAAPPLAKDKNKKEPGEPPSNKDTVLLSAIGLLKSIQVLGLPPPSSPAEANKS